jgi:hypothetical protein
MVKTLPHLELPLQVVEEELAMLTAQQVRRQVKLVGLVAVELEDKLQVIMLVLELPVKVIMVVPD